MTDFDKPLSDPEQEALAEELASIEERIWQAPAADVIGALVECGMPVSDARAQVLEAPPAIQRFGRLFYLDYCDAKLGDPVAKEKVDRCREMWGSMTRRRVG